MKAKSGETDHPPLRKPGPRVSAVEEPPTVGARDLEAVGRGAVGHPHWQDGIVSDTVFLAGLKEKLEP